jgi:hypothetical protein
MLWTRSSRLLKTTSNHGAAKAVSAVNTLQSKLDSARFVLHGRPEAFARWLAIWAEENAPQFMEILNAAQIDSPSHWFPDAADGDIPRSEVFF